MTWLNTPARIALGLALALASCGNDPASPDSGGAPIASHPGELKFVAEAGGFLSGRSEYLTMWHGVDPSLLQRKPEPLLGDDRSCLLSATPARLRTEFLASPGPRRLQSAVRRLGPRPAVPTLFEAFWQPAEGEPRSLHQVTLRANTTQLSEAWTDFSFDLPQEAGALLLVCRDPRPIGSRAPVTEVAWQSPVLSSPAGAGRALPDVLLVTIDTFRSDALEHAPALQAILDQGQLWPQAVAPSNWTLPSYASLFTGASAEDHQAGRGPFQVEPSGTPEDRQLSAVNHELRTLAERFQQAGYATGMVHQNPMLESWTGLNRGFERYMRASDRTSDAIDLTQEFFDKNQGRPRFFVLHLMAPHLPYRYGPDPDPLAALPLASFFGEDHGPEARKQFFALEPEQIETVRARYYAEVSQLDSELGPWLQAQLAQSKGQLILALHSDHGEELWDAGSFEHGHSFDDSVIRVPVALVSPGRIEPAVHSATVPAEALAASLLQLAEIEHDLPHSLQDPPSGFRSSMPLYRSQLQGRSFGNASPAELPFNPGKSSGGHGAAISAQKRRMLAELGYLAGQEMKPPTAESKPKRD